MTLRDEDEHKHKRHAFKPHYIPCLDITCLWIAMIRFKKKTWKSIFIKLQGIHWFKSHSWHDFMTYFMWYDFMTYFMISLPEVVDIVVSSWIFRWTPSPRLCTVLCPLADRRRYHFLHSICKSSWHVRIHTHTHTHTHTNTSAYVRWVSIREHTYLLLSSLVLVDFICSFWVTITRACYKGKCPSRKYRWKQEDPVKNHEASHHPL
jgi:hypothetical protein